jgi:hypothetical protein
LEDGQETHLNIGQPVIAGCRSLLDNAIGVERLQEVLDRNRAAPCMRILVCMIIVCYKKALFYMTASGYSAG